MPDSLLSPRFLFRFQVPCLYKRPTWTNAGAELSSEYRLINPAELESQVSFCEMRAAWSETGLALVVRVSGKKQPAWCRESRPDESDGLHVWVDTRDTHNVHRASRFCHHFVFLSGGSGRTLDEPTALQGIIHRARENAPPVRPGIIQARREKTRDGYLLECWIPAGALNGFDPIDNPRLGFNYAITDRELGTQPFSCGREFPYQEDPSLWATLELVR